MGFYRLAVMVGGLIQELQWDMRYYLHIDLEDYFIGVRQWSELQYFIASLPQGSHVWAAQTGDEELAAAILDYYEGHIPQSKYPPLRGWSYLRDDLAEIKDLLLVVARSNAFASAKGDFKPTPRPKTAMEKIKRERSAEKSKGLLAALTPKDAR